jgi:Putative RNA methylase family UPF0020
MNEKAESLGFGVAFERLRQAYAKSGKTPVPVCFRELVTKLPTRKAHCIHPYPGKLLPHIARFFARNPALSRKGDTVSDPFCGTGTVLLEAALAGRLVCGADVNPLARLIATVKLTPLSRETIAGASARVLARAALTRRTDRPDVVNLDHWFDPRIVRALSRLRVAIDESDSRAKNFLWLCFSACVRKLSRADPRIPVPVRVRLDRFERKSADYERVKHHLKWLRDANVFDQFGRTVAAKTEALLPVWKQLARRNSPIADSADLLLDSHSSSRKAPQLIITSPPYLAAQKYVRASSLSLGWLGLAKVSELSALEKKTIGREHFSNAEIKRGVLPELYHASIRPVIRRIESRNPARAVLASTYFHEMRATLQQCVNALNPGGHIVLIVGNSRVSGELLRTSDVFRETLLSMGAAPVLELEDAITGRGLLTVRRGSGGVIEREHVIVAKKRHG